MAITIAIANQKGGVGKTTSVIELAACFKRMEYNVLVIDLDQQSNLTDYVGGTKSFKNIFNVLKQELPIKEAIQTVSEFDIIPASESLSKASKELGDAKDVLVLRSVLKEINDDYDFIIIDNSPARDVLLNMTYVAADFLIIPTEADEGSINGIRAIFKDLKGYKDIGWSDAEVMGVILTKTERTGMHDYGRDQIKDILENEFHSDAFLAETRKSIVASEAKTEGASMQSIKTHSKPAIDYREIADIILEKILGESDSDVSDNTSNNTSDNDSELSNVNNSEETEFSTVNNSDISDNSEETSEEAYNKVLNEALNNIPDTEDISVEEFFSQIGSDIPKDAPVPERKNVPAEEGTESDLFDD